jgi:hypothetical protein
MKRLLATRNLKPGGGWLDLKARVAKGDSDAQVISALVRQAFRGTLVAGSRYIQMYDIEHDMAKTIVARLEDAQVPPSAFAARYPLPLAGSALELAPGEFTLCEISRSGPDLQLVFCSRQVIEESLTIDGTSSPTVMSTFTQALSGYDKFVAYRRQPIQVFDVVSIRPQLKRIEVALDITQKTSDFDAEVVALKLLFHMALIVPELKVLIDAQHGVNLFPAISEIYKSGARSDTVIVDLGFRTPSGAINRGKMPSNSEDIRDETFHKRGSEGVQKKINPHGIVVNWTFSFPKGSARVRLWTSAAKAMAPIPYIWGAEVSEAVGDSDIVQALNKLTSFL